MKVKLSNLKICLVCQHCQPDWLTTYDGRGLYLFHYCNLDLVKPLLVDAGALRVCSEWLQKMLDKEKAA